MKERKSICRSWLLKIKSISMLWKKSPPDGDAAAHYRQIAAWGLWNFSNVTRKTYQTFDPSIAERASAAFVGEEAPQGFDSQTGENECSPSGDSWQGAND